MWHSRSLLEHFQKNLAQIAVPIGTSVLDEVSVRTKVISFIVNKPDKYAIRFYAVVCTKNTYLFSICDIRSDNTVDEYGPEAFCRALHDMRTPYNKILGNSDLVDKDSPSALWILQMAQQTKLHPDPSGKGVFFTDNFYTRHVLATELKNKTDGEARLCGTVKFTKVDATNRTHLVKAIYSLKNSPHRSWKLV